MFQTLLKKRAANRAYNRIVDDCLRVLFCGFPHDLLPRLRHQVGISSLVRRGQAEGTNARVCSVQVAVLLLRKVIDPLSKHERHELAQAFLHDDARNPTYKGFKRMLQVVEQLNVSPALVSYVKTKVAGTSVSISVGVGLPSPRTDGAKKSRSKTIWISQVFSGRDRARPAVNLTAYS
jgi:hypothetical protein